MKIYYWHKNAQATELDPVVIGYAEFDETLVSAGEMIDTSSYDWTDTDLGEDFRSYWSYESEGAYVGDLYPIPTFEWYLSGVASPSTTVALKGIGFGATLDIEFTPVDESLAIIRQSTTISADVDWEEFGAYTSGVFNITVYQNPPYPNQYRPPFGVVINTGVLYEAGGGVE